MLAFSSSSLVAGVDWFVVGVSAVVGLVTFVLMWIALLPRVFSALGRPLGRFLFVVGAMAIPQFALVGNSDEEVFVPLILLSVAGPLYLTGFWRRWVVWKPFPKQTTGEVLSSTFGALLVLLILFAYFTALLQSNGLVTIKDRYEEDRFLAFEGYYAWHLVDVVPVLKIPATLNLPKPIDVTDVWAGGTLLLLFKVLVAVPVIGVVTQLFAQRHDDDDTSKSNDGASDQSADARDVQ